MPRKTTGDSQVLEERADDDTTTSPATEPETVSISLIVDHVFLPRDPTGSGWNGSSDTVRYDAKGEDGRRNRIEVHKTLADFLVDRDQALIV